MMKKIFSPPIFWVVAAGIVSLLVINSLRDNREAPGTCTPPPDSFTSLDLVGTWRAGSPEHQDTLIIRDDGTYKQVIHVKSNEQPILDYEGEWMRWWLEPAPDGIPYLHLEGMRICAIHDVPCDQVGGPVFDFCRNKGEMSDDGILLVLGIPNEWNHSQDSDKDNRGIHLWYPIGNANTWVYTLVESHE